VLLHLEAELLVEKDGRIVGRHVQRDVFAHAGLKQDRKKGQIFVSF
jgi:hypothetical protein